MAGIDAGSLVLQLSADIKRLEKGLKSAQGVTRNQMRAMERRVREADKKLEASFRNMSRHAAKAFGAIGAALGMRELSHLADQWSDLNARLSLATGSAHAGADAMERLGQVANRSYSSLENTVEAFIANSTALKELGYNTQQQLDYTESLNNALVISGAKGERAKAVMNALSKAMALGKLSGVNLNTVISQGGRVAEALADSMGVTVNQLRELGAAGKIGTAEMFGITSQSAKLGKELDGMATTIGDGFMLIKNALLQYVGTADQATAISGTLANGLVIIANNFNALGDGALMVASLIATSLIGRSIVPLIKKALDAKVAIGGLIVAMRQAQTLSAGIGALMPVGGLIGAAVGLAVGGITLAYLHHAQEAAKAEQASAKLREEWVKLGFIAKEVEGSVDGLSDSLDDLTDADRFRKMEALREELERMTKVGGLFSDGGDIEKILDGLTKQADEFGDASGRAADEALKLGATLQMAPASAAQVKKELEGLGSIEGVNRKVYLLIQALIKAAEETMALEAHMQSLGGSAFAEGAIKSIEDLEIAFKMAAQGFGVEVVREIEQIFKAFKAGTMSVEEFIKAIYGIDEAKYILALLGVKFDLVAHSIGKAKSALEQFINKAVNGLTRILSPMMEITNEIRHQSKIFDAFSKKQDEVNAKTAEQLELERAILAVKSDYEKENGAGNAKYIAEENWKTLAQNKLDADKRRASEGKTPSQGRTSRRSTGGGAAAKENEFERITKQFQERIEALKAEAAIRATLNPLVEDYGFAVNKAMNAHQMMQAAAKAGVAEKEGVKQAIEEISASLALADVELQKLNESQDKLRQKLEEVRHVAKDVMRGFIDDMIAGKSAAEALGNALKKIGSKLLDSGMNALFSGMFAGAGGGGGGGLFSALFRADGGAVRRQPNGMIWGAGSSRSDSIPTMLSNGEFVVNAAATKKHRALLEQINAQGLQYRADGGLMGHFSMPTLPSARGLQQLREGRERALKIDVTPSPLFDVRVQEISDGRIAAASPLIVTQAVKQSDGRISRNIHDARLRGTI